MDIAATIAAVSNGLGIAKTMRSVEKSFDEAAYKAKVADVIEALTDAKLRLAEAKEKLAANEREIANLSQLPARSSGLFAELSPLLGSQYPGLRRLSHTLIRQCHVTISQ